jgi:hypothetical protein
MTINFHIFAEGKKRQAPYQRAGCWRPLSSPAYPKLLAPSQFRKAKASVGWELVGARQAFGRQHLFTFIIKCARAAPFT